VQLLCSSSSSSQVAHVQAGVFRFKQQLLHQRAIAFPREVL
jgi:hypothetical protein